MKRVTITDVAKQAGVSISTASKALSGTGKLNFETINKIISCAEEIGYIPNRAAQMLSRKGKKIGILIPDEPWEVMDLIKKGLFDALKEYENYGFTYIFLSYENINYNIDGLIFIPKIEITDYINHLRKSNIPLITVQVNADETEKIYGVSVNEIVVGKIAAEFLNIILKGKNKDIIIITGDKNVYIHKKNLEGFLDVYKKCDFNLAGIYESFDNIDKAYEITARVLSYDNNIGGIFTTSYVAPGICQCLKENNRTDDIVVIGMDIYDKTIECMKNGSLDAVIYQNQFLQAKRSVDHMVNAINGLPLTYNEKIKPELVLKSNLECYI